MAFIYKLEKVFLFFLGAIDVNRCLESWALPELVCRWDSKQPDLARLLQAIFGTQRNLPCLLILQKTT